MSKSKVLVCICVSIIAGTLAASVWPIFEAYLFGMAAVSMVSAFVFPRARAFAFVVISLCVGAWRYQASLVPNKFASILNTKQNIEGTIIVEPDRREDHQFITINPKGLSQNVLVTTPLSTYVSYGDRVVLSGTVVAAKAFDDFDYPHYLERYNVYALMRYPRILVLESGKGNKAVRFLISVKTWFVKRVTDALPQPENILLLGILIGARRALPQNVTSDFTNAGVSHVIAVSGYNISIIIGALEPLTRFIGRRWGTVLAMLIIAAFVIISGASSSVVRAAVMGSLLLVSYFSGRLYAVAASLWLTAAIMVLINPRIAYWDVGFQLSFLATLGIVYGLPVLQTITEHWPNPFGLLTLLATTFVAIMATMPLVLWQFGRVSLVAPLANILVVPLVPFTMLVGFLAALPLVGKGFALMAHQLLRYMLWVVHWCANLPHASIAWNINGWWVVASYAVLALVCAFLRKRYLKIVTI